MDYCPHCGERVFWVLCAHQWKLFNAAKETRYIIHERGNIWAEKVEVYTAHSDVCPDAKDLLKEQTK